ncbi:MAG: hypothetical protein IT322_06090 [Anaerolineae bacterium]|nr:hypothetical protein [Anaerolineae bacterium]
MRRLALVTLTLVISLSALVGGVRQAHRDDPSPLWRIFTNPDGTDCTKLCLFGLIPGAMTFEEAVARLKLHPLTANLIQYEGGNEHISTFQDDQINVILVRSSQDNSLSGVWLTLSDYRGSSPVGHLTLGHMVRFFGPPSIIRFSASGVVPEMLFQRQRMQVGMIRQFGMDDAPIRMTDYLSYIVLFTPEDILTYPAPIEEPKPWLGFARMVIYHRFPRLPVYP